MIETKVICDSIGDFYSPRLTTFLSRYPKFIHAEHTRHRAFSFSVSSSRAIPVRKNLEEVRSDNLRACPIWWGKEQKGMSAAEELDNIEVPHSGPGAGIYVYDLVRANIPATQRNRAKVAWSKAAKSALEHAEILQTLGVHKSIVNRILEPFLHVNVLWTTTEPGLLNFFGLRLDKAAQPEIRVLAETAWKAWNESTPQKLKPGQWHLPFIDEGTVQEVIDFDEAAFVYQILKHVSVARCGRLSYTSFETGRRSTIGEDVALYKRLVGSTPMHLSPAEHQATPSKILRGQPRFMKDEGRIIGWEHPEQAGNLGHGWIQYRKTLLGEAVATLPEGYAR